MFPLGVWEGLRFVIVALPGLFSYLFLTLNFIGKLLVFRWELIVLLLLPTCFFFVTRKISWSLSHEAFNSTSRYLDDLLNIDNIYFDLMVDRIYATILQWNRANSSDTEAPFLDLNLCISNGTVSTKLYDKRHDFDFDIVNFPFLDGDVLRRTSYGVYVSQLIRFSRAS